MKKVWLKFSSIFCVFTLILSLGIFPTKVLGNENNLILDRAINKDKENYNVSLNVKLKNKTSNKNKDIILAIDENCICKENLSVFKENTIKFIESILQDENSKISIVNLNDSNNDRIVNFTSNKDTLKNVINNISYNKNNNNKLKFLSLQNQLTNSPKDSEKYIVLLTNLSKDEILKDKVECEKNLADKFKDVNFMNININTNNNLQEQYEKIKDNILKDTTIYKNFIVNEEIPNNFEVVSATLNGKEYTPYISNNKVILKINKMPLKGLEIKYTLKAKDKILKDNDVANAKAYLEYDELTYKNCEKVNHENIQFENCMVKDDENSTESLNKEKTTQKVENNFLVKENDQLGNITIENEVLNSNENKNYKNQFWWSLNCLKNSQVVGGTFQGVSVNIPQLISSEYTLTLGNPVDYDFISIEVNGKAINLNNKQETNIKINIDKNNPNTKIKIVSKFSVKGYFHSSNAAYDKFPPTTF